MKSIQRNFGKRTLLAALLAGGGILAVSAYAVTDGSAGDTPRCEAGYGPKADAGWEAKRTRHLAALKEKLALAPGQEAAWNAFVEATQPAARMGAGREAMRDELAQLDTPQRLDRMLAASEARRVRLAERVEATKAFYAQLTPDQQRVFDAEAIPGSRHGHHGHRRHHAS